MPFDFNPHDPLEPLALALTMSANGLPNFFEVTSPEHFQSLLAADLSRISLINFWAPWAEPCKQMNEVVAELAKKYPQLLVLQVRAHLQRSGSLD